MLLWIPVHLCKCVFINVYVCVCLLNDVKIAGLKGKNPWNILHYFSNASSLVEESAYTQKWDFYELDHCFSHVLLAWDTQPCPDLTNQPLDMHQHDSVWVPWREPGEVINRERISENTLQGSGREQRLGHPEWPDFSGFLSNQEAPTLSHSLAWWQPGALLPLYHCYSPSEGLRSWNLLGLYFTGV